MAENASVADPFPKMARAYAIEINGTPVWQRNIDQRLAPASLTKLMTALLVIEQLEGTRPVTVSRAASRETGSRLGLKAGQILTVQDLLAATLLASANDACRALADHLGSDPAAFVHAMNTRAVQIGMHHTHFSNACGHDAPGHYTSVADLLLLARQAWANPRIRNVAALQETRITSVDGSQEWLVRNTNALIGRYAPAIGLKTGTTPQAGKCLIAVAKKGQTEVLLVMLHGADRWWDAVDVMELAFARAQ